MSGGIILIIYIFLAIIGSFIAIGNEQTTVRRLPWITFSIIVLNVLIYFVTFPMVATDAENISKAGAAVQRFLEQNPQLLADDSVREQLIEAGIMTQQEGEMIERQVKRTSDTEAEYKFWLGTADATKLKDDLTTKLGEFKQATEGSVWYQFGLAPNGKWKFYQLITCAFIHGGLVHLVFNLISFFAIAFTLEDLWGRGVFSAFYLTAGAIACLPNLIDPLNVPCIGASGAISAVMGAFLIRLPRARIKLLFLPFAWIRLLFKKKALTFMIPGYVYLVAFFVAQLLSWQIEKRSGMNSGVGYTVHIAGFVYGAAFAGVLRLLKIEEKYIDPKIESKVSFEAAPAVSTALRFLDSADPQAAERALRTHLVKQPNDTNALLALIQVYQAANNFSQLNSAYARLIRVHLSEQDKEAALYAYDSLLSAFPDDKIEPQLPARDWLTICEYLRERQMTREAGVEYERMVRACIADPLAGKAAVQGGEASLAAGDVERALRLFKAACELSLPTSLANRADMGFERAQKILNSRPSWTKQPPKKQDYGRHLDEEEA
ncbi:MAG TPA: rhomboid family intramembrane serine protease [Blastocatellia bacterium]|nr:rhomboid family intramembrane serine protease [Blastocatellia bacterium]